MEHTQCTADLFQDIIDHRITAIEICIKHDLTIDELAEVVESPQFTRAARQLAEIERMRAAVTAPIRHRVALAVLQHIAENEPETPTHAETVRKCAAQLARLTAPDPNPKPNPKPNQDATPQTTPGRQAHAEPDPLPTPPNCDNPDQPARPGTPTPSTKPPNQGGSAPKPPSAAAEIINLAGQPPADRQRHRAGEHPVRSSAG